MRSYGLELGGQLAFNGTLRGKLQHRTSTVAFPSFMSSLTETIWGTVRPIVMTPDELRIADGRLTEKDGGGMQFTLDRAAHR